MEKIGVRNIFLIIIGAGIFTAAFIFKTNGNPQDIFSAQKQDLIVSESFRSSTVTDSDLDGVPDWQETLYGTDPKNPNTFGTDGGDSAYIATEKNPETPEIDPAEANNLTVQLGRGAIGEYIYARGTEESSFSSPEELIEYLDKKTFETFQPTLLGKSTFRTVNTNKSTLLAYANMLQNLDRQYPDELLIQASNEIINTFNKTGDENTGLVNEDSLSTSVSKNVTVYDEIITALKEMSVPDILLNEHVNLTNSFVGVKWSLEQVAYSNSDPARALIGAQSFPQYAETVNLLYKVIVGKLADQEVHL